MSMKRTRSQNQSKNTNSTVAEEKIPSEDDTSERQKICTGETKTKLSFENLTPNHANSDSKKSKIPRTKKFRTTVDLKMMKEELKQLEDPPLTQEEKDISSKKLPYSFYDVSCTDLAKKLLGKILVRRLENGTILKGRIVETEAYLGIIDKASQTHQGKVTPRNWPLYMSPGTIYVYLTYGMYHCFNVSSGGEGCGVLLRGLEPIEGIEEMRNNRLSRLTSRRENSRLTKIMPNHEISNGPSKLCIALQIDRKHCKYSICNCKFMWIENDEINEILKIVKTARIGIDSAGPEWANKTLRYYVYGNTSVSKRDKKAEGECISDD